MAIEGVSGLTASVYSAPTGGAVKPAANATEEGDFGAILASIAGDATKSLALAEQASAAAISGKGNVQNVVQTVMQAEQSLQTMIALRDKTVAAIQEITRMSI